MIASLLLWTAASQLHGNYSESSSHCSQTGSAPPPFMSGFSCEIHRPPSAWSNSGHPHAGDILSPLSMPQPQYTPHWTPHLPPCLRVSYDGPPQPTTPNSRPGHQILESSTNFNSHLLQQFSSLHPQRVFHYEDAVLRREEGPCLAVDVSPST